VVGLLTCDCQTGRVIVPHVQIDQVSVHTPPESHLVQGSKAKGPVRTGNMGHIKLAIFFFCSLHYFLVNDIECLSGRLYLSSEISELWSNARDRTIC